MTLKEMNVVSEGVAGNKKKRSRCLSPSNCQAKELADQITCCVPASYLSQGVTVTGHCVRRPISARIVGQMITVLWSVC